MDCCKVPFRHHFCQETGQSKVVFPYSALGPKRKSGLEDDMGDVMEEMDIDLNFPIPLDRNSTLSFVGIYPHFIEIFTCR